MAIAVGVYLLGFGMLVGIALDRMRFDGQRTPLLTRYDQTLREWKTYRMAFEIVQHSLWMAKGIVAQSRDAGVRARAGETQERGAALLVLAHREHDSQDHRSTPGH